MLDCHEPSRSRESFDFCSPECKDRAKRTPKGPLGCRRVSGLPQGRLPVSLQCYRRARPVLLSSLCTRQAVCPGHSCSSHISSSCGGSAGVLQV